MENLKQNKENKTSKDNLNTAYDDVFRTLLNDCSKLIIPVLNEIFKESYTGDEEIIFSPNELFIKQPDGKEEKRITDSSFKVISKYGEKNYLCECQSNPDSSMIIRFYEYSVLMALRDKVLIGNKLKVSIPHCAVLFLRSTISTPNKMTIEIETPKGLIEYDIEVMKTQEYSLEELFEKRLLFLLPYYIFKHESKLEEYDKDIDKLYDLQAECYKIVMQLENMVSTKEITAYIQQTIMNLYNIVTAKLASKYQNVVKGVDKVMGGQILDYPAKDILNQGKAEGRLEGKREGKYEEKLNNAKALLDLLDDETIADRLGLSIDTVKALRKA